jgi:hypothetical protein
VVLENGARLSDSRLIHSHLNQCSATRRDHESTENQTRTALEGLTENKNDKGLVRYKTRQGMQARCQAQNQSELLVRHPSRRGSNGTDLPSLSACVCRRAGSLTNAPCLANKQLRHFPEPIGTSPGTGCPWVYHTLA